MSYLVSVVVIKSKNNRFRYAVMGGFDGMYWRLQDNISTLISLNNVVRSKIRKIKNNYTTIEKLLKAPVDEVIIIGDGYQWSALKGRKPLDNRERKIILEEYLKINK